MKKRRTRAAAKRLPPLTPGERHIIACHECGHAIVQAVVDPKNALRGITLRRTADGGLGATRGTKKTGTVTQRKERLNSICILYGGRAAEEVMFRDVSDASHHDLAAATEMAFWMVRYDGMGEGMLPPVCLSSRRRYSEMTIQMVDEAAYEILESQYLRAFTILEKNVGLLQEMAAHLLKERKIDGAVLQLFLQRIANILTDDNDETGNNTPAPDENPKKES